MENNDQDNDLRSSLQLIDLLKREIALMREVLADYSMEESFLKQGDINQLDSLHKKRRTLFDKLKNIRKEKQNCKTGSCDHSDLQLLNRQIDSLKNQISDKDSLLQSLITYPPQVQKQKMTKNTHTLDSEHEVNET